MLPLLLLLSFIILTAGQDGGFETFCKSQFLDSNRNGTKARLLEPTRCGQHYKLLNLTVASAAAYCAHRSPFTVNRSVANKNGLTCVWTATGTCAEGHYIRGHCFKLMPKCFGQWKLFPMNDNAIFRWLALYFSDFQVAKVAVTSGQKQPAATYYRGVLLPPTNRSLEKVVLLGRMSAFGAYPGDIFYLDEENKRVSSLCWKKAQGEPLVIQGDPTTSGAVGKAETNQAYRRIKGKDGSYDLTLLKNLYSPRLLADGSIDPTYFHEVCDRITPGSFAATPDYLKSSVLDGDLGSGKYYMPGGRPYIPAETGAGCSKHGLEVPTEISKWKILLHPKHKENLGIVATADWRKNRPDRFCSDQGRCALAFQKGSLIDVPIFDRLPVICVSGPEPRLPANIKGHCLKHSEFKNDTCTCKKGFVDAMTIKEQPELREYGLSKKMTEGHVCVVQGCNSTERVVGTHYESILFVVDGSGSINATSFKQMRTFIYEAVTWLPRKSRIFIMQYSIDATGFLEQLAQTAAYWDEAEYKSVAEEAVKKRVAKNGGTPTYEAIEKMTNYWETSNPVPKKALMLVITDGQPSSTTKRLRALTAARDSGIDIKFVPVGHEVDMAIIREDALGNDKDIFSMENYQEVQSLLPSIVKDITCSNVTIADFDDAMQYPTE